MTKTTNKAPDNFVNYCIEFYGTNGIYPLKVSDKQIKTACDKHYLECGCFEADTFDRETVRARLEK